MDREIRIVPRDGIPLIQEIEQAGEVHVLGELRDFRWNDLLRSFMPDATQFAISWVELGPGEVLQPHTHPIQTMLVISAGSGGISAICAGRSPKATSSSCRRDAPTASSAAPIV